MTSTVHVEVSGLTGSGKSAVMGEIEVALKALGLKVEYGSDFQAEKNGTHADWQAALDLYQPTVVLTERNISRQPPAREDEQPVALPTESAPRDGTMLRLRVRYEADNQDEAWTPLEDSEESWTIGFNNFDNTGVDRWQFVGWDWSQDYLLEATGGTVIGWLPFHTHPAPDALRVVMRAAGFLLDRLRDLEQDVNERDFYGHVHPAASRLRQALAALQAEQGAK